MWHLPVKLSAAFTDEVLTIQTTSNSIKVNKKCRLWLGRLRLWHRLSWSSSAAPKQKTSLSPLPLTGVPQLFCLVLILATCGHNVVVFVVVAVVDCCCIVLSRVSNFFVVLHKFLDIVLPKIIEEEHKDKDEDDHNGNEEYDNDDDVEEEQEDDVVGSDNDVGIIVQDIEEERFLLILFIDFLDVDVAVVVKWCLWSFCGIDNIFVVVAGVAEFCDNLVVVDINDVADIFSNAAALTASSIASNVNVSLFCCSFKTFSSNCWILFRRLFEFL